MLQKGTEQHEQEDIGCGNTYTHAKQALAAPEHVFGHPVPAVAGMPECAGNQISEEIVGQEYQRQGGEIAHHPAGHFKTDKQPHGSHDIINRFKPAAAQRDVRIVEDKIAKGEQPGADAQGVVKRGGAALSLFPPQSGIKQKGKGKQKKDVYRPQSNGIHRPEGGSGKLKQREEQRQSGDDCCPGAGVSPCTAFTVLFFHKSLGQSLIVRLQR